MAINSRSNIFLNFGLNYIKLYYALASYCIILGRKFYSLCRKFSIYTYARFNCFQNVFRYSAFPMSDTVNRLVELSTYV